MKTVKLHYHVNDSSNAAIMLIIIYNSRVQQGNKDDNSGRESPSVWPELSQNLHVYQNTDCMRSKNLTMSIECIRVNKSKIVQTFLKFVIFKKHRLQLSIWGQYHIFGGIVGPHFCHNPLQPTLMGQWKKYTRSYCLD